MFQSCNAAEQAQLARAMNVSSLKQVFSPFLVEFQLFCSQSQGQYCLPSFAQSTSLVNAVFSNGNMNISAAQLNQICSSCFSTMLNGYTQLGLVPSTGIQLNTPGGIQATLQIMCLQENNQYCLPEFFAATAALQNISLITNSNSLPSPQVTNYLCNRCVQRAFSYVAPHDAGIAQLMQMSSQFCARDPQGNLCVNQVRDISNSLAANCLSQFNSMQCNTTCANLVNQLIGAGCCADWVANLFASSQNLTVNTFELAIRIVCQISQNYPATCAGGSASFTLNLPNLKYSYFTANLNNVSSLVAADMAVNSGLPAGDFNVSSVSPSGSGCTVAISINTPSATDAAAGQAALQAAQSSGTLVLNSLAGLPSTASVDASVSAGATTINSGSSTISGAVKNVISSVQSATLLVLAIWLAMMV